MAREGLRFLGPFLGPASGDLLMLDVRRGPQSPLRSLFQVPYGRASTVLLLFCLLPLFLLLSLGVHPASSSASASATLPSPSCDATARSKLSFSLLPPVVSSAVLLSRAFERWAFSR